MAYSGYVTNTDWSEFIKACEDGKLEMVKLWLSRDANPNEENKVRRA